MSAPVARWQLSVYPSAREAGGSFIGASRLRPGGGVRGAAVDPERSLAEAGRRARGKVRRYCAANGLSRLGTLTYRGVGCHDPAEFRAHVGEFFRNLRDGIGNGRFPYVWVPELHPGGHGLHGHFALGRYVKRSLIADAWGRGFVHIKLLGNMPSGSTTHDEARRAAGYLSKYVAKTFDQPVRVLGGHRYDLAQGFQPVKERITGATVEIVRGHAIERFGAPPSYEWRSWELEDWSGPSAVFFQWR